MSKTVIVVIHIFKNYKQVNKDMDDLNKLYLGLRLKIVNKI